jgi:segregation and condensation protein A
VARYDRPVVVERAGGTVGEFSVALPVYAGPFRDLAELILAHKVDVCDVPVASVTEAFLARAAEAEAWSLEEATWFVAVGAVLLELKVGRMMPRLEDPTEDDLLGGSSPDLAYARSLELGAMRRAAADLAERLARGSRFVPRRAGPPPEFAHLYPDVMDRVTAEALAATAAVLLRPPPLVDLSHVGPVRVTVSDAIHAVTLRLNDLRSARFADLVADCPERIDVVVRFLALLELYREGKVELSQAETFGEILVRLAGEAA